MRKIFTFLMVLLAFAGLSGQPALAKSNAPVKVSNAKAAAGAQQVVVGQFTLAFLTERKDNAKARGGIMGGGFGGKSTVVSKLEGVDTAAMQQVADAAYEDFVAQLAARGFTVVDRAELAGWIEPIEATEALKEVKVSVGKDDTARAVLVGASRTGPLRALDGDYLMNGMAQMGERTRTWKLFGAMQDYVKQRGVNVVNVIYYVNFADSDEYAGGTTSRVKINGSLGLAPDASKVSVVGTSKSPAILTLEQPVGVGGDFFEREDTMGGGEKALRAVNKVAGLLGGLGSNSVKKFAFTAKPGAYPEGAIEAAVMGNALFADQLAALR